MKSQLICCFILGLTIAHKASQCFEQGKLLGGASEAVNGIIDSDLTELMKLTSQHVITSVKVCTNRKQTLIKGVQAVYGKYDAQGEIVDPILMHEHGNLDESTSICENFYVKEGDSVAAIIYRYDSDGIKQFRLVTSSGSGSYGVNEDGDIQIFGSYSASGGRALYGFTGR